VREGGAKEAPREPREPLAPRIDGAVPRFHANRRIRKPHAAARGSFVRRGATTARPTSSRRNERKSEPEMRDATIRNCC